MKRRTAPSQEAAEMLAIQVLAFIAEEPERLNALLSVSGIPLEGIREAASEPGFLAGILDHMLGDESLLLAFVDSANIDPEAVAGARRALGGPMGSDMP